MAVSPSRESQTAIILLGLCAVVQVLSLLLFPPGSYLYPSAAVGAAGLFFGGLSLWPAVFIGILIGELTVHSSPSLTYISSVALTGEAVLGAYILRAAPVDPLFRKYRDTAYLIVSSLFSSVVLPLTLFLFALIGGYSLPNVKNAYVAALFTFLIIVPFMLRWYAKPSFRRSRVEGSETLAVLITIVVIDVAYFLLNITQVYGFSLLYVLAIPLFWTAIRLRPRFVTLAMLITAGFALLHALLLDSRGTALLDAEWLMITLSVLFFIIVSLEEDRRVQTNLLRSQLATLENAIARISGESKAKNDFIAILAHELRNPLAPVVSAIDHMRLQNTQSHDDKTLTIMEESMKTVKRLLDDLLDVSRIAEGKIILKREPLVLSDIVERAIVSTEHYFKDRHQALTCKHMLPLTVEGDAVRLEQVFSNLLTNASKYSKSGDTITVSMAKVDGMAEVRVADEGIGIEPHLIETIFLPFHQLEPGVRHKKGLGIGLALVNSFVAMHGGTIEARSAGVGKGSTFIVRLPISKGKASTPHTKDDVAVLTHTRKQILVVDDNDAAAAGIGRLLEHLGVTVQYAYTGKKAIEKGRRGQFDAIILDVGLPDMEGYVVARILREKGYEGKLIGLSGYSTPDAREKGKASGFDQYLIKPAGLAELQQVLHEVG